MNNPISTAGLTLGDAVDVVHQALETGDLYFGHGTEDALEEAYWLVLSACGEVLGQEDYEWEKIVSDSQGADVDSLLRRRLQTRKPLAYLLKRAWFAGLEFYVDERALVPRSFMAEWLPDQFAPWVVPARTLRILDLCCGSGCIGIAAALAFPAASVVLSDVSEDALAVARENIKRYSLADRVSLNRGATFSGLEGRFDLILCNPPYVSTDRMERLPDEYRAEPELALEAGENGLDFLTPFLASAADYLSDHGALIVEAGSAGPTLEETYPQVPFTWLGTEHDEMVLFHLEADALQRSAHYFKC